MESSPTQTPIRAAPTVQRAESVARGTKFAWGLSGIADTFMTSAIASLVMPVYNLGFGVNPILIGYAMAVPRLIDAVADPAVGSISDNTRMAWGRRRPYVLAGTFLCAALFPLIWRPPALSEMGRFLYLLILLCAFSVSYSIFSVPCTAMGFEFSSDYDEKTRIMAWRFYLSIFAGFAVQWLYRLLVLPALGGSEAAGIRFIAPAIAAVVLLTGLPAGLFCRERVLSQTQPKIGVLQALKLTSRNRAFFTLMTAYVIVVAAVGVASTLGLYVNLYYVCGGDKAAAGTILGVAGTVMIGAAALSMALIAKTAQRTSKRIGMLTGLALAFLGNLSLGCTLRPDHRYLQIVSFFFVGLGVQGCWLMVSSMAADSCAEDEVATGMRREGMYSAVGSFCMKVSAAGATALSGYLLSLSGYRAGILPSLPVVFRMKLWLIGIECGALAAAFGIIWFYPLSRDEARENQRILSERA